LDLLAHGEAEVQIGRQRRRVRATEVSGEERTRLWRVMTAGYEGFEIYDSLTDRDLKLFVLEALYVRGRILRVLLASGPRVLPPRSNEQP
jgi:hypothetical protein